MHTDRRPSTAHDRPSRTPFGPRQPKIQHDMKHTDAAVQAVPTFVAPPPLTPPPQLSFESTQIPWKGLPLEAAQWSFSSEELQEIVSKAIRLSARDSFVRLLSIQALEVDIVRESERLETARLAAQASWRFQVGRRTMLMHALNAAAAFSTGEPSDPVLGFVAQLASTVASCDSLLSTILQISDQQSQVALIQHQHWASALGVALRKLNKAHERQGQELERAQARVHTLEDELEEAWREAERMAIEFDDFEQEFAESEPELPSEVVDDHDLNAPCPDFDETGTLGDMTIQTDIGVVLGVTATAVASRATLVTSSPKHVDKSDTKSIRSVKSTRSRRSTRDGPSHASRLSSARLRSRAASNASLRLPKALRSPPSAHTSPVDVPPMPSPLTQGKSFLDLDNLSHEHIRKALPPKPHPEPALALPSPPHSAGLPATQVPSIWLESDGGQSTHLGGTDRSRSLQIFSSLAPGRVRRSNLVMSLTGSNHSSDGGPGSGSGSPSASSVDNLSVSAIIGGVLSTGIVTQSPTSVHSPVSFPVIMGTSETAHGTASPTSNHSPVSLPTHALAHFRSPSQASTQSQSQVQRPGSAGARLTTHGETKVPQALGSPRRSLMSRASSVILRRLSQATIGSVRGSGAGSVTGGGSKGPGSPSRARDTRLNGGRLLVERWKDKGKEWERDGQGGGHCYRGSEGVDEEEGEVMLIGSPHADVFDAP